MTVLSFLLPFARQSINACAVHEVKQKHYMVIFVNNETQCLPLRQASARAAALLAEQQAELKERLRHAHEAERAVQELQRLLTQREADINAMERHLMVPASLLPAAQPCA
jgi:hypothetical protein